MTVETRTQEPINWPAVDDEALDILVRYLRIPSVNPPGDEAPAARFLGSLLSRSCYRRKKPPGFTETTRN